MKKAMVIIGFIIALIAVFALESVLCMYIWNTAIVALFNANVINFWIACGIMFVINFAIGLFRK